MKPPPIAPRITQVAVTAWLSTRGWRAFGFQRQVWKAMLEGRSGLLHASTGTGKTLAVWLGALIALGKGQPGTGAAAPPCAVLWITPMRALASDTLRALAEPLAALAPAWSSGLRSGDTSQSQRSAQDRRLPTVLVTTPET